MHHKSLRSLADSLQKKEFSSVELTQHFLNRINQYDTQLNSFITVTAEHALKSAQLADQKLAQKNAHLLTGIPIAHKDTFCTKGIKTSCGSKMLDNFIAPYDATLIEKFNHAGCIILGKTNMDEFAMGSTNENSYYGPVNNPWNFNTVPGGSSGGSAAAVAARLAPAATGTDTGGSIRQPAAFCGITGLKPTYGRISRYGMVAFASSLDHAGPFAGSAEDIALLLNVMAGHDDKDSTSVAHFVPDYTQNLTMPVKGLRIGLVKEFMSADLDNNILLALQNAYQHYEKMGVTIHEVSLPNIHLSIPAYYIIAPSEASSNLARYDGVRYGYRCNNPKNLQDLYERSRGEGFGEEVKRRIMLGTFALSAGYFDDYYLKAQKIRRLISDDFKQAFQTVDLLICPTTPCVAFKHNYGKQNPLDLYLSDIFTIAPNLAGLPAISLPIGFINNMPVGMQVIGNYFNESQILNVAHQFQQHTDWHLQIPNNFK